MNKLIIFPLFILVAACDSNSSKDYVDRIQNACAELTSTRVIDRSKRMDILKSYNFTPLQAQVMEGGLERSQITMTMLDDTDKDLLAKGALEQHEQCIAEHILDCQTMLILIDNGANDSAMSVSWTPLLDCIEKIKYR